MKKMSKKEKTTRIRREAALVIREISKAKAMLTTEEAEGYPDANIDDVIRACYDFANEDEVFEAIVGTKYSTLYDACGTR